MVREGKSNLLKKEQKKSKKLEEIQYKKKQCEDSDSSNSDSDSEEEMEMDMHEYNKFLSKIFPSKYINKKIKNGEKIKKQIHEESINYPNIELNLDLNWNDE